MTFFDLAIKVLKEENTALPFMDIWGIAEKKGYTKELKTKGKTPWATLGARIGDEVRHNPKSIVGVTNDYPLRYYIKSQNVDLTIKIESSTIETAVVKEVKAKYLERDLHKILNYYAHYYLKCQTKTINHSVSTKSEFGEWVHPDIVGCYFPLNDWKSEVYELSSVIGNTTLKLFSFELKRELNFSNLRASFFQAVSNSSWSNEGYLVAANISKDTEFRSELSRLSSAFGIGVIELNIEDPDSSDILFRAKAKDILDWETINKLVGMNDDFKEFISQVKIDISSKKIHKKEYDAVPNIESLVK